MRTLTLRAAVAAGTVLLLWGCAAPSPTATTATTPAPPAASSAASEPSGPAEGAPSGSSVSPRGDGLDPAAVGQVVDIVDGDTVDLADGTRVRLAIVNTPEVHGGVEPCGPEASEFTGAFLAGQTVAIYRPSGAPEQDQYGRAVGEVVRVTDGASLNVALHAAGLAQVDRRFVAEDPDLTARLDQIDPAIPGCAAAATPTAPAGPNDRAADGGCHPAYEPCLPVVDDLDCADVGETVTLTGQQDPYRLDGNSDVAEDGTGCG